MEEIDTLATQKSWAQGSLQKPFTSIVTLYMHEQLSLEQAVREITGVIKNIHYGDGDVDEYLLDLWLTTLHTSKKLPRPTTSPPDLPTPLQSRLLALLSTLRRQPNPIPRPHIDTQNPIPDDPFITPPPSPSPSDPHTSHHHHLQQQQQQQQQHQPPKPTRTYTRNPSKRITWSQLPRFLDAVRITLHDEPGRPTCGFSELEVWAWEDLVAFLALCARHQIVPDPEPGSQMEDAAMTGVRGDGWGIGHGRERGSEGEGEGEGGLDAVAVRMMKGALEVRHFPTEALSEEDHLDHRYHHGATPTRRDKKRTDLQAREEEREKGQIAEAVKLNVYVAAAALWAVIMGEELWERQGQKVDSPVGLSLEPVPAIPAGKISKPRWRMWIDRFQFMSLREDLRISTRELAAEAAAVMLRVV